jgi:hypothetical protein
VEAADGSAGGSLAGLWPGGPAGGGLVGLWGSGLSAQQASGQQPNRPAGWRSGGLVGRWR